MRLHGGVHGASARWSKKIICILSHFVVDTIWCFTLEWGVVSPQMIMLRRIGRYCLVMAVAWVTLASAQLYALNQESEPGAVARSLAAIKPLVGRIDSEAERYFYLQIFIESQQAEKVLSYYGKEYSTMRKRGVELILCSIDPDLKGAVATYKNMALPMPLITDKAARKLPGYQPDIGSPYVVVVDHEGRCLAQGMNNAIGKWTELLTNRPTAQEGASVVESLRKLKMIQGRLSRKAQFFFYVSASISSPYQLPDIKRFNEEYKKIRAAGAEVIFCAAEGRGAFLKKALKEEGIKLPVVESDSALSLPGYFDGGVLGVALVDGMGKHLTKPKRYGVESCFIENWAELIEQWRKEHAADVSPEKAGD